MKVTTAMRRGAGALVVLAGVFSAETSHASPPRELCRVLHEFVGSVAPEESRSLTFHTIWGAGFKDAADPALGAKQCEHGGYPPGEKVCDYLLKHGPMEFSETTAEDAISCLSKGTRFGPGFELLTGAFSIRYGTDYRGAFVGITFNEDPQKGGMALKIDVDGY